MVGKDRFPDGPLESAPERASRRIQVFAGGIMLLVAVTVTAIAVWIAFGSTDATDNLPEAPAARPVAGSLGIASVDYPTPFPIRPSQPPVAPVNWIRPTAAAAEIEAALDTPILDAPDTDAVLRKLDPLTILPARSRHSAITYTVQKGDTLRTIAEQFGLEQSTIVWSNDRFYVNAMRVGLELNILPVDGVYHHVQEPQTIAAIAELYGVDPYVIVDSEYNTLFGATPQTTLPEGYAVIVPGGKGSTEPVYWDPGIVVSTTYTTDGSQPVGAGIRAGTDYALFAVGDPGSCGKQAVYGGSPPVNPPILDRYTITQDFSWEHGGIDLSVPVGTRVYAAGSGTVIFSGWSTWGYGYTVVIAHGGTLSIYGHLNGAFVGCGQIVSAGQNIAVTGNSGRSSGPHLHFEIRGSNGAPVNPWEYQSF